MGFLLKVYFIGMIGFLPGPDGNEMTVLVLDVRDGYYVSDGSQIEAHVPILVARAASCSGNCQEQAQEVADFLFQGARVKDARENLKQLQSALAGGSAWKLDGSDLVIETKDANRSGPPSLEIRGYGQGPIQAALPVNREEAEDFYWVAEIGQIAPGAGAVDPDVLSERPEKGLIAARLRLREGMIRTERLVAFKDRVVPLAFTTLRDTARRVDYSQALADWIVAEIPVEGCSVRLGEKSFNDGGTRSLTLSPQRCDGSDVIEMVLVNLPASSFGQPPAEPREPVGKHFEVYYELSNLRPPNGQRPVPILADEDVEKDALPLRQRAGSPFLQAIGLPWRGIYSRPICPVSVYGN